MRSVLHYSRIKKQHIHTLCSGLATDSAADSTKWAKPTTANSNGWS